MDDAGYRHLPVVSEGRVIGIVSRRDFFGSEKARLESESDLWERL
jgi:predicted transcriptional regulator